MKLKVVSSGSVGNSYIIYNDQEALILECGVRFKGIKEALNFQLNKVVGCLVSHSHQDHCKGAKEVLAAGIDIYCLQETADAFNIKSHRIRTLQVEKPFQVGGFKVIAATALKQYDQLFPGRSQNWRMQDIRTHRK